MKKSRSKSKLQPVAIGPFGDHVTLEMLPLEPPRRWVRRRKAEVAAAVRGGLMSLDEVERRYGVKPRELEEWRAILNRMR